VLEKVTSQALEQLLGPGSRSVRFGWPSDSGRPADFNSAIKWLSDLMKIRVANGYRPPRRKDGGVDVVAWRPFPDGRPGFPVALAQCTIEGDFLRKARDVDLRQWSAWLALDSGLLLVLAVPGTLANAEMWNEIARNCVVLERIRLTALAAEGGHEPSREVGIFTTALVARLRSKRE
jgi:hypothetical protein